MIEPFSRLRLLFKRHLLTLVFRGHVGPRDAAPLSRRRPDSLRVRRRGRRSQGYRRRRREHLRQREGDSRCSPWQHWTYHRFPAEKEEIIIVSHPMSYFDSEISDQFVVMSLILCIHELCEYTQECTNLFELAF